MRSNQHLDAPIKFHDRGTGVVETEKIYAEGFLRWVYGNPLGRLTLFLALKRHWFSRWYGWLMDQPKSRRKIKDFINSYGINMKEFAEPVESFKTFNQFFYRRLKPECRPINSEPSAAVFPADGRHLAMENIDLADAFYIKGQSFNLSKFMDDADLAKAFAGGSVLISRLCPVDYHRYHFPVAGEADRTVTINGSLRSVSPLALRRKLSIFWENRRARTMITSPLFGQVLIMEVGATCVGGMHTTFLKGPVTKGQEKGYFSFGGSCVVTIFQKGVISFDEDLLRYSAKSLEVYAKMGERCGLFNTA